MKRERRMLFPLIVVVFCLRWLRGEFSFNPVTVEFLSAGEGRACCSLRRGPLQYVMSGYSVLLHGLRTVAAPGLQSAMRQSYIMIAEGYGSSGAFNPDRNRFST